MTGTAGSGAENYYDTLGVAKDYQRGGDVHGADCGVHAAVGDGGGAEAGPPSCASERSQTKAGESWRSGCGVRGPW